MTLLNHIGVLIALELVALVIYLWMMLGIKLVKLEISKWYIPYALTALIMYLIFEAFYWTFKIFFL